MMTFILMLVLGIVFIVIGCVNMTGNISSLHSYHRKRVREEDKKPMGRAVGIGMLVIAFSMIAYGALFFAFERTQNGTFAIAGAILLLVGLAVGAALMFWAMVKYNKGIF